MASINLAGFLVDPTGEFAVGDQIRFTHKSTTGDTIKNARSVLIIPPGGAYDIDLEFGNILVEYLDVKDVNYKIIGIVTVNGDSTAVTLPELLLAIVPPTDEQLLEFQNILAEAEALVAIFATDEGAASVGSTAGSNVQQDLDALFVGQTGGLIVFKTKALLDAFTPSGSPEEESSYKVTNDDITNDNNGYYNWNGASFDKDANLVETSIDQNNTSDGVSGSAVYDEFTDRQQIVRPFTASSFINPASGAIDSSAGFECTADFIPVREGETYATANEDARFYAFYDKDQVFISSGDEDNSITIPSSAEFFRWSRVDTASPRATLGFSGNTWERTLEQGVDIDAVELLSSDTDTSLTHLISSSFLENETLTNPAMNNEGFINSSGVFTSLPGNVFRSSDFILLDDLEKLRLKYESENNIAPVTYYSANNEGSFISDQGISTSTGVFDTIDLDPPTGALYYRLSKDMNNLFDLYLIDYTANTALEVVQSDDISENKVLFNQIDLTINTTGGFLDTTTGNITPAANWLTSEFKDFNIDKLYVCVSDVDNSSIAYIYLYDESFNYLGFQGLTNSGDGRLKVDNLLTPGAKLYRSSWNPASSTLSQIYEVSVLVEADIKHADAIVLPIYGQSNALGYSANPPITDFCKYPEHLFNQGLFPLIENSVIEAVDSAFAETSMSSTGEKVFSDVLQKQTDTRTVAVSLKGGQGGASIADLIQGTNKYNALLREITRVTQPYLAIGKSVIVPAFSYIQGETEVTNAVDYKGLLTQMQIDLDTDIKAITGQAEDVYCCVYNLSWLDSVDAAEKNTFAFTEMRVAKAQHELIKDNAKFITSTPTYGIIYNPTDPIHFSNIGQRQIGIYQGDSISKLLQGTIKKGVYIASHSISVNTITLTLATEELPLIIDTTVVPARLNHGFTVISTGDTDLISSVVVDENAGTIDLICSSSPVGAKIRYGCGGTVNVWGGNIKDSSSKFLNHVILGNIYELSNWLQMFEIDL